MLILHLLQDAYFKLNVIGKYGKYTVIQFKIMNEISISYRFNVFEIAFK